MKRFLFLALLLTQIASTQLFGNTVVAIHGLMASSRTMIKIQKTLYSAGFNVYLWDYVSRAGCVEEHASCLVSVLQEIACECPNEPIDFVTHSIGAIILRAALNDPNCPEIAKCGRAVLIAPPNQGSSLARRSYNFLPFRWIMGSKMGRQLATYCPWVIQAYGPYPSSMNVLVLAGCRGSRMWFDEPNDGFLAVQETELETPYYSVVLPQSHGALLTNRNALCVMKNFLLCDLPECAEEVPCDEESSESTSTAKCVAKH